MRIPPYCHACRALKHSECVGGDSCSCFCPTCDLCSEVVDGALARVNGPPQPEASHTACKELEPA